MADNLIILTSGISGSSVLTGLVARGGYWTGDVTFQKTGYNTHENLELVELNRKLLAAAGYTGDYTVEFEPAVIGRIKRLYGESTCSHSTPLCRHARAGVRGCGRTRVCG
jgi:hypothetical protein